LVGILPGGGGEINFILPGDGAISNFSISTVGAGALIMPVVVFRAVGPAAGAATPGRP